MERQLSKNWLLSLLVVVACCGLGMAKDDWEELHKRIFTPSKDYSMASSTPIASDEVYDTLKRLYEFSFEQRVKGGEWEQLDTIMDLVDGLSLKKCDKEAFNVYNLLIGYNSNYKLTMVPFLKEARRDQYKLCQKRFITTMKPIFNSIVEPDRGNLLELKEKISPNIINVNILESLNEKNIEKGIVALMKEKGGDKVSDEEIMANVAKPCFMLQSFFFNGSPIEYIKDLVDDDKALQEMDEEMRDWLITSNICARIIQDMSKTLRGVNQYMSMV